MNQRTVGHQWHLMPWAGWRSSPHIFRTGANRWWGITVTIPVNHTAWEKKRARMMRCRHWWNRFWHSVRCGSNGPVLFRRCIGVPEVSGNHEDRILYRGVRRYPKNPCASWSLGYPEPRSADKKTCADFGVDIWWFLFSTSIHWCLGAILNPGAYRTGVAKIDSTVTIYRSPKIHRYTPTT